MPAGRLPPDACQECRSKSLATAAQVIRTGSGTFQRNSTERLAAQPIIYKNYLSALSHLGPKRAVISSVAVSHERPERDERIFQVSTTLSLTFPLNHRLGAWILVNRQ